ncbi:hypothetical protein F0562_019555 [Nyssa sinensis]|uniref:Alpha 1,4-glycosyltransferase domain-containing protein n=1 Tax=Nyssa sinensis TaxID=561372 RepID=A0A5J5BTZ3_9ASTE|nr:hypothetical protein F0562_019555 [Nyssa sinensis]
MLRNLRARRRPRYGAQLCAVIAALLLLLSVSLLHSRLGSDRHWQHQHQVRPSNDVLSVSDPLLDDADPDDRSGNGSEDRIDELDVFQDESDQSRVSDEEEILRVVELEDEEIDQSRVSGYYFDHISGVIRRVLDKRSIDQWEDYASFDANLGPEDRSKVAFGSDDVPVDENVRRKVGEIPGIEDVLLLKMSPRVSPLREGWGPWFDAKSDFLRRDRMFKSNLELLNPLNNPLLQDPDGIGVTGLTRGDKLVQKGLLNEFKKVPFLIKKPLGMVEGGAEDMIKKKSSSRVNIKAKEIESNEEGRSEMKRAERRTLDDNASNGSYSKGTLVANESLNKATIAHLAFKSNRSKLNQPITGESIAKVVDSSIVESGQLGGLNNAEANGQTKSDLSGQVYADGRRWGYFHGLHPRLSFSNFMDAFFRKGKCSMRVFMVWNSPPWMFSVRHQRGLESLFFHHRDACVVLFSETIELNFFKGFLKDGFKVAVAMPNLDELLKDTPAHVFASVWFEWRKTKFYSTHYSELVRLAALYKYGGMYLDSDIIVLKPLSSLNNTVGLEDQLAGSSLNGAVMSFRKHSPFIMECLMEFYSTYDDTRLRWNGADLLTRVARRFLRKENICDVQMELKLQPSFIFFPISRINITRYFTTPPATESERTQEDDDGLFKKILNESFTFHFWNSLTSALIPEPNSLVARLIDHHCIHCSDVL